MSGGTAGHKLAGGGAVLAAALASACCILPAVLGTIGLSGAVLSAFFEPLRPWFLGLSAAQLGLGFFLAFRRTASGAACGSQTSRLARAARPTLIVAALATAGLAMFPGLMALAADELEVRVRAERPPKAARLVAAVERAGYTARVLGR